MKCDECDKYDKLIAAAQIEHNWQFVNAAQADWDAHMLVAHKNDYIRKTIIFAFSLILLFGSIIVYILAH